MDAIIRNLIVSPEALFIKDREELLEKVEALKAFNFKISFTQGVFDMFHTGHVRYLKKAKEQGDILIVGIDTDELTRARKGPDRPYDSEEERYEVIGALRSVDILVPKDKGEHEHDLLKLIKPDVFVISVSTGPEIQKDIEVFETMCGRVVNLERQSSTTTTAKLRRLKKDSGKEIKDRLNKAIDDYLKEQEGEEG